jgi:hypothetical protein
MEFQRQNENVEAASLVSSFSLNVATTHLNDDIATALYDQQLAERHQTANRVLEERHWMEFYDGTQTARCVVT